MHYSLVRCLRSFARARLTRHGSRQPHLACSLCLAVGSRTATCAVLILMSVCALLAPLNRCCCRKTVTSVAALHAAQLHQTHQFQVHSLGGRLQVHSRPSALPSTLNPPPPRLTFICTAIHPQPTTTTTRVHLHCHPPSSHHHHDSRSSALPSTLFPPPPCA
jgi:hypothetical protein